ncbi:putative HAD superfamily protein [Plasmopara halstedii]
MTLSYILLLQLNAQPPFNLFGCQRRIAANGGERKGGKQEYGGSKVKLLFPGEPTSVKRFQQQNAAYIISTNIGVTHLNAAFNVKIRMPTIKLAKAAAQQLKGVVIEYDVLCSTLVGKCTKQMAPNLQCKNSVSKGLTSEVRSGSSLFEPKFIKTMLVSDVRNLLKELNEDSTGRPWVLKDRLKNTLQGLPNQILERFTGSEENQSAARKREDEIFLEQQLKLELKAKQQKEEQKNEMETRSIIGSEVNSGMQTSSLRDKYMGRIQMLKEKSKQKRKEGTTVGLKEAFEPTTSAGLSTWVVNDGANEVLSYSDLRGLFKAVIPPRDPLQDEEYEIFKKEMKGQFDMFVPKEYPEKFPDSKPILNICEQLGLKSTDMMVLARHSLTIKAAKQAGTHVCHYMPGKKDIPNHTAHYHLTNLHDYQYLIEEFNGISYRDKIKLGSIEF